MGGEIYGAPVLKLSPYLMTGTCDIITSTAIVYGKQAYRLYVFLYNSYLKHISSHQSDSPSNVPIYIVPVLTDATVFAQLSEVKINSDGRSA